MTLTEAQRAAVTTAAPNVLVVGGAGSRKTATLVARLAYVVLHGAKLNRIAVITYTNAAAAVIGERLSETVRGDLGYCGTLHGFCLRYLQEFVYPTVELRVIDEPERDARLLRAASEAGVKATLKQLLDYKLKATISGKMRVGTPVHIALAKYHTDAVFEGLLDYEMILAMAEHGLTGEGQRYRWEHFLVDEYQDASPTDAVIFENTPADNRFYVGDPMQAIFAFRGGDVSEFRRLVLDSVWEKHYLMENWRSTPEICAAATRIAVRAATPPTRPMVSTLPSGPTPHTHEFPNAATEALTVANGLLLHVKADGDAPESMAVLARTNEIANNVGAMLRHVGLPTRQLIDRQRPPDWTKALAALGVLARPESVPSLIRWARLQDASYNKFYEAMTADGDMLKSFGLKTKVPITGDADKMAVELDALGISAESIRVIADRFDELPEWLDFSDLELELMLGGPGRKLDGSGVFVGTIHSAKGMEWDTVVMVGCEDEVMPGVGKRRDEAEERRVFYVGMTRARRRLLFTWAASRPQAWGGWHGRTPSRFLNEVLTGDEKGAL